VSHNMGAVVSLCSRALLLDAGRLVLDGVEVEDTVHVLARQGGVLATYNLNQHQAPNELTITIVCERGTARFENHASRWRSMEQPGGEWVERSAASLERDTLFTRQADTFLDAIEGKGAALCSLDEGLDALRATTAILRSVDEGGWRSTTGEA